MLPGFWSKLIWNIWFACVVENVRRVWRAVLDCWRDFAGCVLRDVGPRRLLAGGCRLRARTPVR